MIDATFYEIYGPPLHRYLDHHNFHYELCVLPGSEATASRAGVRARQDRVEVTAGARPQRAGRRGVEPGGGAGNHDRFRSELICIAARPARSGRDHITWHLPEN